MPVHREKQQAFQPANVGDSIVSENSVVYGQYTILWQPYQYTVRGWAELKGLETATINDLAMRTYPEIVSVMVKRLQGINSSKR